MPRETDQKMPVVVHIDDPRDVARKCKQFGCTQDELKGAVKATGSVSVENIEAYLKAKGQKRT
jgi:hypothetical protein